MKRTSPNVVYVGDITAHGERVVHAGTGLSAVVIVEASDGQRLAVPFTEV